MIWLEGILIIIGLCLTELLAATYALAQTKDVLEESVSDLDNQ
ncbi:MAG TPA: hypothetical protein VE710_02275 [Candidatus Bathyarchaeia archaeon]|nr:hypothetical protein [Candidatus Bathyarchaeia archaeon]